MDTTELLKLSADRPLATLEIHQPNAFYGNASVLRRYAGLPGRRPLKVAIEHGIAFVDVLWEVDLQTPLPVFLCSSPARAGAFQALVGDRREAIAIGPLIDYVEPIRPPRSGSRLLAFPAHSSHHVEARYEPAEFGAWLSDAAGDFDAVTVCLYWREVLRGHADLYRELGFECVTAGHIYDPAFLGRLRTFLDEADAVVTNDVGSHLLYAVGRGLPVALVRQQLEFPSESGTSIADPDVDRWTAYHRGWEVFGNTLEPAAGAAADYARGLLGLECRRSPSELRTILDDAERRYRAETGRGRRAELDLRRITRYARSRVSSTPRSE